MNSTENRNHAVYSHLHNLAGQFALADVPGKLHARRVEKGAYIYQPGDPQTHIHLIEAGVVKIGSYLPDGDRAIYDVLQPGEFFGDLNYLNEITEFFEFAKAATSLRLLSIEQAFFKYIIVHDSVMSDWFNQCVVRRWWKAETRLLCMTRGDVEARLNNLRNEYDKSVYDDDGKQHNILELLSHQNLGDLTGASRQTVSKKLQKIP